MALMDNFKRLVEIMANLRAPGGCPWDREQDHKSLKPYLVEETYEVIDAILKGYVEEALSPEELTAAGHSPQAVMDVIRRVDQNEYKRFQAAPGLKVTPKAFGEGRRYPLAKRFRPVG